MEPFTILLVPFLYPSWEFTLCWKKGPWFTKGNVCVVCGGGLRICIGSQGCKKTTKKEKQEQKTKKIWSFLPICALVGSCLFFLSDLFCFFLTIVRSFWFFLVHFSGLILAFWIFLFMFISALSLSFFCIYLPLCSLNFAYWCSCLLLFAQFCSV